MAEEGQVISCHTVESWNEQLQKGIAAKKLVYIYFLFHFVYSSFLYVVKTKQSNYKQAHFLYLTHR